MFFINIISNWCKETWYKIWRSSRQKNETNV